jgi:hypothetical protein
MLPSPRDSPLSGARAVHRPRSGAAGTSMLTAGSRRGPLVVLGDSLLDIDIDV